MWPDAPHMAHARIIFKKAAATIVAAALWLYVLDVWWLFVVALPVLLAGTWLGLKLYGRLDEVQFRTVVLVLLLASGVVLLLR